MTYADRTQDFDNVWRLASHNDPEAVSAIALRCCNKFEAECADVPTFEHLEAERWAPFEAEAEGLPTFEQLAPFYETETEAEGKGRA